MYHKQVRQNCNLEDYLEFALSGKRKRKKILPITILKINTQKISNGKVQEILQIYLLNLSLNEKGNKKSTMQTMFLEDM